MNPLDALARDPVIGSYLHELTERVEARSQSIFFRNQKGMVLARALERLPDVQPSSIDADRDCIRIGAPGDIDGNQTTSLHEVLCALKPWRKGPFEIFGIRIDSEWNSSIKWNRLAGHLGSLAGKRILDIGSSCGYYMFRLAVKQPALILGIEPYPNFYFQFLALARYLAFPQVHCLPLKLEEMPAMQRCFDMVMCMGILYHRRSPLDTLLQIHGRMVPGGQLVLETLVMEGDNEMALFPEKRYAKMNNIFFIPTVACLTHWLTRSGFEDIQCLDISRTTSQEQRKTDWIDTESLADFLDPGDPQKTVEGYPAPVRAMLLATARRR
ncbi:MAG: tRNA 5-methoxyuridine(34)/uridine 5-oxyacetic acid(34) synthase CmoB [Deltaproteobacteria bacterium]|nr:tRNA 5-methoxyuridine(34)/uridine 5-oxyacetic acid(34) synthase CmoB [Deltaproteobacteria bacterium]